MSFLLSSMLVCVAATQSLPAVSSTPAASPLPARVSEEPDTIGLIGTARASGARGYVRITSTPSPFTLSVTVEGHPILDLDFRVEGLLDPAPLGGDNYVVWVASPQLDRYERIGVLENNARATGSTSLPKWLAVVTVESGQGGARPAGPIVLHGLSPSGRLQSFQGHELFDGPKIGAVVPPSATLAVAAVEIVDDAPLSVRYTLADGRTIVRRASW